MRIRTRNPPRGPSFARKANKALALVDQARRLGLGLDLAGERELEQALARGVEPQILLMSLLVGQAGQPLEAVLRNCTTVVIDEDQLQRKLPNWSTGWEPCRSPSGSRRPRPRMNRSTEVGSASTRRWRWSTGTAGLGRFPHRIAAAPFLRPTAPRTGLPPSGRASSSSTRCADNATGDEAGFLISAGAIPIEPSDQLSSADEILAHTAGRSPAMRPQPPSPGHGLGRPPTVARFAASRTSTRSTRNRSGAGGSTWCSAVRSRPAPARTRLAARSSREASSFGVNRVARSSTAAAYRCPGRVPQATERPWPG